MDRSELYIRELSDDDALPKSISTKTESYNKHAIRVDDIYVGGNQNVSHVKINDCGIHNGFRAESSKLYVSKGSQQLIGRKPWAEGSGARMQSGAKIEIELS